MKAEIISATNIEPKEIQWLWKPYIPFGKVTIVEGDGGDGKTIDIKIINDRLMRELLFDDHRDAYLHYMSVSEKKERESAANVLPILLESGLAK